MRVLDPRLRIIRGDNTRDPSAPARVLRCLQITRKEDAQGAAPVPAHPEIRTWLVDYASDSGEHGESSGGSDCDSEQGGLGDFAVEEARWSANGGDPSGYPQRKSSRELSHWIPRMGSLYGWGIPQETFLGDWSAHLLPLGVPHGTQRGSSRGFP